MLDKSSLYFILSRGCTTEVGGRKGWPNTASCPAHDLGGYCDGWSVPPFLTARNMYFYLLAIPATAAGILLHVNNRSSSLILHLASLVITLADPCLLFGLHRRTNPHDTNHPNTGHHTILQFSSAEPNTQTPMDSLGSLLGRLAILCSQSLVRSHIL